MKYLIKIDHFFAWVLFGGMLLYFISGYGITKGIIDPAFAAKLHLNILTYIILIAFIIHPIFAIHLALKRWCIWNISTKLLLFTFFAVFLGAFIYVDRFYQPQKKNSETFNNNNNEASSVSLNQNSNGSNSNSTSATTTAKTFTITELSQYDGQNGNSAYVAVDGDVYDLSAVFVSGKHFSHYAGKELTNPFYSYHAKNVLLKYPIVGQLVK